MMLLEAQLEKQSDYQGATEELEKVYKPQKASTLSLNSYCIIYFNSPY